MCPLEHDIEVVKILKSHIGKWKRIWVYMLMGWTLDWALDMCGVGPLVQIIIIIFIILFFELVSLYTTVISKTVYLFSNVCMHSPSFMKNNFWEKLFKRKNILCIHLSQRERKRHRVVRKARTLCASSLCCRSFYLGRQTSVSLKATQIVWGVKSALRRLCQTQDLILFIHPSRS